MPQNLLLLILIIFTNRNDQDGNAFLKSEKHGEKSLT